jgi:trehalose-phosphatase
VTNQLRAELVTIPGIILENKGYTLSVHYRLANRIWRQKALQLLTQKLKPFKNQGLVLINQGKAVWEIKPAVEWDKGSAVVWVLKQPEFKGRWPLYIGDDKTDQDAFRTIRNCGIGVSVGPVREKGFAHYTIGNPEGVYRFLKKLLDLSYEW